MTVARRRARGRGASAKQREIERLQIFIERADGEMGAIRQGARDGVESLGMLPGRAAISPRRSPGGATSWPRSYGL
jgi:hypothetical protein